MATEQDIKTIRNEDGRGTTKVLILATFAAGKLARAIRLDGRGSGNEFVINTRQIITE